VCDPGVNSGLALARQVLYHLSHVFSPTTALTTAVTSQPVTCLPVHPGWLSLVLPTLPP
jgi:hypothetical protein